MNFYNETTYNGELWLRDANNNVVSANNYLSAIYLKYETIDVNFYNELKSNIIKKFDIFYDSFLIQTSNVFIFEKYKIQDSQIIPANQINNYFTNSYLDYWFDETKKKVYFVAKLDSNFTPPETQNNKAFVKFGFEFYEFDIKTGQIKYILSDLLNFDLLNPVNFSTTNGIFEDFKLTYNPDTNNFNISVIVRNDVNEMGLLSINFNEFEIKEVNAFIPFGTLAIQIPLTPTPTPTPTLTKFLTPTPTPTPTSTIPTAPAPSQTPTPSATRSTSPAPATVKALYISFE
jgi:hypothetical protein